MLTMTSMIIQIRKRMKTNNDKKDNLWCHKYDFCSCHSGSNCNSVYGAFYRAWKATEYFWLYNASYHDIVRSSRSRCAISQDGDNYIYTTKGDANNAADLYDAQSRYLIGKVIWSSLFLGKLSRLAANPLIFIPLILIPLAAILITNLVHTVRLAKTIAKEEEEAAVKEAIQSLRAERENHR